MSVDPDAWIRFGPVAVRATFLFLPCRCWFGRRCDEIVADPEPQQIPVDVDHRSGPCMVTAQRDLLPGH